jgi:hypothetical protein
MYNARALSPMTTEQLRTYAPSVFATQPYDRVSDSYRFIPTSEIVAQLADEGFVPVKARESRTRIAEKRGFTKHEVRFAHRSLLDVGHELVVGGTYPLAVLTNSHDTGSSFKIDAGMFRLACSNGMMLPSSMLAGARVRHSGDVSDVIEGVFSVVQDLAAVPQMIESFSRVNVPRPVQIAYATSALHLRDSTLPLLPEQILQPRRREDTGNDLWSVTNRIQENLTKGGLRSTSATGRRMTTRAVVSIDDDQRLNKALFVLAAQLKESLPFASKPY